MDQEIANTPKKMRITKLIIMKNKIDEHEELIRKHNESSIEAGNSLLFLRKTKAYKEKGHENHGDYVESLGIQRSRASQLECAARHLEKMKEFSDEHENLPKSEGALRYLVRLAKLKSNNSSDPLGKIMMKLWEEAVDRGNGPIQWLKKKLSESLNEGSNGVQVSELKEQPINSPGILPDEKPRDQKLNTDQLAPKDWATRINKTLNLFRSFKESREQDIADKIEKQLRELKEHFDQLDPMQTEQKSKITHVK